MNMSFVHPLTRKRFSCSILSWAPKSLPKKSGIFYNFYCKISAKAQVSLGVLFVKRGRVMGRDAGIQSEGFRTDAQSKPILSHTNHHCPYSGSPMLLNIQSSADKPDGNIYSHLCFMALNQINQGVDH